MHARKLLIVDDEPEILQAIAFLLSKHKGQVLCASSGSEAMEILRGNDVGLIISDFKMRNGDGESVLNYALENDLKVEFYFFTASNVDRFLRDKTIQGHFVKPGDFNLLLDKAKDFLKGHRGVAPEV